MTKSTTLVLYPPGGYGTFLEWALTYYSGNTDISDPFTANGSSHNFVGNHLDSTNSRVGTSESYFKSSLDFKFARTHGVTKTISAQDYYNKFGELVYKFICLEPSDSSMLLVMHNSFTKPSDRHKHRQAASTSNITGVDRWEERSSIANWFYTYQSYLTNWYKIHNAQNTIHIGIRDLVDDTKSILLQLFDKLNLDIIPSRWDRFDAVHSKWANLQRYSKIDHLCKQILESVVAGDDFTWDPTLLTIHDESFIQWALRSQHRLDLRSFELSIFPHNSIELMRLCDVIK